MLRLTSDHLQALGTLAAALAALLALFVAWDQGRVMRAQQHASVLPLIEAEVAASQNDTTVRLNLNLRNDGVGPAFIQSVELWSEGEAITSRAAFDQNLLPENLRTPSRLSGGSALGVLAAGESVPMLSIVWERNEDIDAGFQTMTQNMLRNGPMTVWVCYCSVFERCWRDNGNSSHLPQSVKSCQPPYGDIFPMIMQEESPS